MISGGPIPDSREKSGPMGVGPARAMSAMRRSPPSIHNEPREFQQDHRSLPSMNPATRRTLRQACVKLGILRPALWLNDKIRFPGPARAQAHAEAVAFYGQFI